MLSGPFQNGIFKQRGLLTSSFRYLFGLKFSSVDKTLWFDELSNLTKFSTLIEPELEVKLKPEHETKNELATELHLT